MENIFIPTFDWGKQKLYIVESGKIMAIKPIALTNIGDRILYVEALAANGSTCKFSCTFHSGCATDDYRNYYRVNRKFYATPQDAVDDVPFKYSYTNFTEIVKKLGYVEYGCSGSYSLPKLAKYRAYMHENTKGITWCWTNFIYDFRMDESGVSLDNVRGLNNEKEHLTYYKTKEEAIEAYKRQIVVEDFDGERSFEEDSEIKPIEVEMTITIKIVG